MEKIKVGDGLLAKAEEVRSEHEYTRVPRTFEHPDQGIMGVASGDKPSDGAPWASGVWAALRHPLGLGARGV